MYNRILVALDGSATAERVLPHAESLAEKYGATLTLLRAITSPATLINAEAASAMSAPVPPPVVDPAPIVDAERQDAQAYLGSLAERLSKRGLRVDSATPEGDAASAIVEQAREHRVDLIAMTTHGHGGLGRVLMGSVADSVVRHAACPVLLVRVSEDEAR